MGKNGKDRWLSKSEPERPASRPLQVYAIDPSADTSLATASISRCVLSVRWEKLGVGPIGQYVEVIDIDPASGCLYDPVDLEHPHVVARDGLNPSEGSPQFHQQMVYAVVMKTIENFERALGRPILWSERIREESGKFTPHDERYVPRLRIYPHALRESNAYYSPAKKALLFGYFNAPTSDPRDELPGGLVFSCLSHDIIAHETTHAILDGIHRRLLEPTNVDMLAFHEAFADIVAIFQHFTLPGLVLDQMQRTRGDLSIDNLLAKLAIQFGRATQRGGALRNALGRFDANGQRQSPNPKEIGRTLEPHDRGAIMVAAVFDAFLRIYDSRVSDLRRIATGGTGVLPQGDIHPDLARRFAAEAVRTSQHVLDICIRALDYLPPVDISFGDYLRALITADAELVPDDTQRHRLAFIESFRNHGIFPIDVRALGEDSLRWRKVGSHEWDLIADFFPTVDVIRTMVAAWEFTPEPMLEDDDTPGSRAPRTHAELRRAFLSAYWNLDNTDRELTVDPDCAVDRRWNIYQTERQFSRLLYFWMAATTRHSTGKKLENASKLLGINFTAFREYLLEKKNAGAVEVHAVRPTFRVQADGKTKVELLVILTQKKYYPLLDDAGQPIKAPNGENTEFRFRGGCTLLIDPESGCVRYAVIKRLNNPARQERNRQFFLGRLANEGAAALDRYRVRVGGSSSVVFGVPVEPLGMLHRNYEGEEW